MKNFAKRQVGAVGQYGLWTLFSLCETVVCGTLVCGTLVCGTLATGCSIDDRQVQIANQPLGSDAGTTNLSQGGAGGSNMADMAPLGEPISSIASCDSSDCAGELPLAPCTVDCETTAEPRTCPQDDVCRTFGEDCAPSFRAIARDGEACECDSEICKFVAGEACTGPGACSSGDCRPTNDGNNVCCDSGCEETDACSPEGTSCEAPRACVGDEKRCAGSSFQQCSEGQWTTLAECDELGCDNDRGGCLRSVGQACAEDADCGEGNCATTEDGTQICCTANCGSNCQSCSSSGTTCDNNPNDIGCGEVACPADSTCRTYSFNQDGQSCSSGRCASPQEVCNFTPRNSGRECDSVNLCDSQGNCGVPKKEISEQCSTGNECASGACIAGEGSSSICCSRVCAPGELCSDNGSCVPAPVCTNGQTQCSGTSFQRCVGGQWNTQVECGVVGCSVQRNGCFGATGDSCNSDTDCGVGRCQDSSGGRICCTAACDGACRQCAPSGQSCENLNDDAACGLIDCPSDTVCNNFSADIRTQRCVAGRCGTTSNLCTESPRNANQVCSSTSLCDNFGNCSRPKKQAGAGCSGNDECGSNFCVDGVCCNEDCNGTCETCANTGICRAPADDPVCPAIRCGSFSNECVRNSDDLLSNRCRSKGVCETEDVCDFVPARTACSGAVNGKCDGEGQCRSPIVDCGGFCSSLGVGDGRVCCAFFNLSGTACVEEDQCGIPPNTPIECDDPLDCDSGDVCCFFGNSNGARIACLPSAECAVPSSAARVNQEVCGAPGKPITSCGGGKSCQAADSGDRLAGWSFCQ